MIDLTWMKGIRVDPRQAYCPGRGRRQVGGIRPRDPGLRPGHPWRHRRRHGHCRPHPGGGIGWLSGRYGLSCDNLIAADIVTADGQFRHVSASEHQDLFWGIRGGGGNFGVVTSFEYQLHAVGPMVLAGVLFYPFAKAKEYLRFYSDFSRQSPDELNTIGGLGTSHDGAKVGVMAVCYSGPLEEGEQVLRPVREFGPPLADHIQTMPYTAAQQILAPLAPAGRHYYIKSHFINGYQRWRYRHHGSPLRGRSPRPCPP